MRTLLCRMGLHRYGERQGDVAGTGTSRTCHRCGKRKEDRVARVRGPRSDAPPRGDFGGFGGDVG